MSDADSQRVAAAIAKYDGKDTDSLAAIAARIEPSTAVLQSLCELVGSDDARIQSASSWLLRRYVSAGAILSQMQSVRALTVLTAGCHWEARLHVLQMMEDLTLPSSRAGQLWGALVEQTTDGNKFIRAWSYQGLAVIADQHPPYRERALNLLAAVEQEEAASVRARIRRIRKTFKWAG